MIKNESVKKITEGERVCERYIVRHREGDKKETEENKEGETETDKER